MFNLNKWFKSVYLMIYFGIKYVYYSIRLMIYNLITYNQLVKYRNNIKNASILTYTQVCLHCYNHNQYKFYGYVPEKHACFNCGEIF